MTPKAPRIDSALLAQIKAARGAWGGRPTGVAIEPVGPGEESVWDFPRPPEVQDVEEPLEVSFAGRTAARTERGRRVVETAGAPVYFFPPEDVDAAALRPSEIRATLCEWKGAAVYFDLVVGDRVSRQAAFAYPEPLDDLGQGYSRIAGWIAFYAGRVDRAMIGDAVAAPQPGGYYAGWVAPNLRGPIKGAPGSEGW